MIGGAQETHREGPGLKSKGKKKEKMDYGGVIEKKENLKIKDWGTTRNIYPRKKPRPTDLSETVEGKSPKVFQKT